MYNGLMPEGGIQSNALEQEIAQIEQDLASKRATLEEQKQSGAIGELPHEKETLREVVREQYASPAPVQQQATIPSTSGPVVTPPPVVEPPSYLSPELKEKVQELVNIAFAATISDAIKQAQATNNAALIDAFHDALIDELYSYLIERGRLTKM